MRGWSNSVKIVSGNDGYAYISGQILVSRQETQDLQRAAIRLLEATETSEGEGDEEEFCGDDWERQGSGDEYWLVPSYPGDVPAAIRRLKGAGIDAQPNHVFFLHNAGPKADPGYADPGYADPGYADPGYADPGYADPGYADPGYADPGYADRNGRNRNHRRGPIQGQGSLVYPSPIVARSFYSGPSALRYELTGVRPSNAVPLFPDAEITLPDNAAWDANAVRVAVIDTGWPPDEASLAALYPGKTVGANASGHTDVANADIPDRETAKTDTGTDPSTDEADYLDPAAGHGLFIAGLIQRYAPGTSVDVTRALSSYGDGSEQEIASAIDHQIDREFPPHILNLSFGTYTLDEPGLLAAAVKRALGAGIVVVASAGNEGISREQYPAAFDGVISVAALGPEGPARFSNWGDWVRACAPGVDIPSAFWTFDGKATELAGADRDRFEGWALWSGTSFAAPVVASAIAQTMQRMRVAEPSFSAQKAAELVVDYPGLHSIRNYGTVVNPPPGMANL